VRVFARAALSVVLLLASFAASAQEDEQSPEQQRRVACFEAKDWPCFFDDLVAEVDTDEFAAQCLADRALHADACAYVGMTVYLAGIGASETADSSRRIQIAEHGIAALDRVSEGTIESEGELHFSALRYDACKAMNDAACIEESARMIRLAVEWAAREQIDAAEMASMMAEMDSMLLNFGVRYPIDLRMVMAEVARTEAQQ
jgi:hypothetical protein